MEVDKKSLNFKVCIPNIKIEILYGIEAHWVMVSSTLNFLIATGGSMSKSSLSYDYYWLQPLKVLYALLYNRLNFRSCAQILLGKQDLITSWPQL